MSICGATGCAEHDVAPAFLQQLRISEAYPHPVNGIQMLETHISYVFLTGRFAYKIKKAVSLGFLDFTQLQQRRFFCEEELRLNRRLAPSLYLAVVPICETPCGLRVGGTGPAIEYAVKMLQFPQSSLLDHCLAEDRLKPVQVDAISDRVAAFHAEVVRTTFADQYGTADSIHDTIERNLQRLRTVFKACKQCRDFDSSCLDQLEEWYQQAYRRLKPLLEERKLDGYVRECHGDLHLGNIAWWRDAPQIFDGIEFSRSLRWIDVMNEVAFTTMDFKAHGRCDYAYRFLNRYLENTGDYTGLKLHQLYETDRAVVRAMVACIRATQESDVNHSESVAACRRYITVAKRCMAPRRRMLLLMHGLSGSGKTTVSQAVLERIGAIRIRSDVERKRLCGMASAERHRGTIEQGIYDHETTRDTYHHLVQLARQILDADFSVVVDAANLHAWQREIFRSQACAQAVPFLILRCQASEETLCKRLQAREVRNDDVSDAGPMVLRHQLATSDPLSASEKQESLLVEAGEGELEAVLCRLDAGW